MADRSFTLATADVILQAAIFGELIFTVERGRYGAPQSGSRARRYGEPLCGESIPAPQTKGISK